MDVVTPKAFCTLLTVGFHPENVCCDGCWCLVDDPHSRGRKICFLTNEIIYYPKQRGLRCPLEEVEPNA